MPNHLRGKNNENYLITRIWQVDYRDLLVELKGFASRITRICRPELIGLTDWIGHLSPKITAVCRGFTKMKVRGNISKSQYLNPEKVHFNFKTPIIQHQHHFKDGL